jgi:UDP-N-acetylmuramoylalanine--D-glutamate ligase
MMDLTGKRVMVMGLGHFGGGVGVTRWLAGQGAEVLVTDLAAPERLADSVRSIDDLVRAGSVALRLGGHNVSDFTTCDLVVASPAVPRPWENRFLRAAEAARVPITTEISLLLERLPSRERTIAVTGSVGKSTTAAMIAHAMSMLTGDAALGGNIGGSLLERLGAGARGDDGPGASGGAGPAPEAGPAGSGPPITARTWVVLEVSSAMLYWIDRTLPRWSPRVAVVTNLSANHLDWHSSFEHYRQCKQRLVNRQEEGDTAVLGAGVADWAGVCRGRVIVVDPASFKGELRVPGEHNRANAAAARSACLAAVTGLRDGAIERALATFPGLPHRLELVAEHGGVRYYNDSKSTTPDATLRAVEALASMPGMSAQRVHLIAGGYDKGIDLSPIAAMAGTLGGMYTVGTTGPALALAAGPGRAEHVGTVERAVSRARERMEPGDCLLLSPGCASWDQFVNYEERGRVFAEACRAADAARGAGARP